MTVIATKIPAYARTARPRTKLSRPTEWLYKQGRLVGLTLDYGCGRGFDADCLGLYKYDPWWFPNTTYLRETYHTIVCNYVLNVIADDSERQQVINTITSLLKPGGIAYITVRNDSRDYKHRQNSQSKDVELKLPLIRRTNLYKIYAVVKGDA